MRVLFEFDGKNFVMSANDAAEIVRLIHSHGAEIYEHKTNWRTKEESHHVYNLNPTEQGAGARLPLRSDRRAPAGHRGPAPWLRSQRQKSPRGTPAPNASTDKPPRRDQHGLRLSRQQLLLPESQGCPLR